ncbi:MAG TPA: ATP-binding protein [Actinomycetota bacterium]
MTRLARIAWLYVAVGLVAVIASFLVFRGSRVLPYVQLPLMAAVPVAMILGVRKYRPARRGPWLVLTAGAVVYTAALAIWAPAQSGLLHLPFPSFGDGLFLLTYFVLMAGIAMMIRFRTSRRDRSGFLDTLVVAGGLGVLPWVFLIDPYWHDASLALLPKVVSVAFPLADLLLLGVLVRLAFLPGRRRAVGGFLGIALAAQLVADTIYSLSLLDGTFSLRSPAYAFWNLTAVFLAAAALHPSMRTLTERVDPSDDTGSRWRIPLITGAALAPSIVLVAARTGSLNVRDVAVISAVLVLLAMARMWGLMATVAKAKKRLERSEMRYRTLVEQVPATVYVGEPGPDGAWEYLSPQLETMVGYKPDEWTADPNLWLDRVHPEDRQGTLDAEARSHSTGKPLQMEYRFTTKDGRVVWIRDEARLVPDKTGDGTVFQGLLTDITPFRDAQAAIEMKNQELEAHVSKRTAELQAAIRDLLTAKEGAERSDRAKSEFLSRSSHELRTPLNAILGFSQLLEGSHLHPEDRESVEEILKAGRRLLALIDDVLDVAHVDAGRDLGPLEPTSVGQVIAEALDLVRPVAANRSVELRCAPIDTALLVLGDSPRLRRALQNLLTNAVKFNREGGDVVITATETAERISIHITDTGQGIANEDLDQLFSPFARLGAERVDSDGRGLGLTVAKALVESMDGEISVATKPGSGSTFTLELIRAQGGDRVVAARADQRRVDSR